MSDFRSDFFYERQGEQFASFGRSDISPDEKPSRVRDLFGRVADNYDLMNDLMSAGLHRLWKDKAVEALYVTGGKNLLDLAGGTGDIAARFLARGGESATICDLTEEMVVKGRERFSGSTVKNLRWVVGDAEAIPFEDNLFDCVTVCFGLRNMTHLDRVLGETVRVLKAGGRFVCLEFSKPRNPLLSLAYDGWSFGVIPSLGRWVSNDEAAYRYLVESIRRFPDADELADLMSDAGLKRVRYQLLAGGIAALHSGWKFFPKK